MIDERVSMIVERDLRFTAQLQDEGVLARVYECPGHVAMRHDRTRCRYCGTSVHMERD